MAMTPRSCSLAKSRLQLVVKRLRSCRHSASSTDSTELHRLAVALRFRPMNDSKTSEDRDSDADHNADEQQQRAHASGSMRSSAFLSSSRWGVIVPRLLPNWPDAHWLLRRRLGVAPHKAPPRRWSRPGRISGALGARN